MHHNISNCDLPSGLPTELPTFVSASEVADALGVTTETLAAWEASGLFPRALRPTKRTKRWDLAEILDWAATHTGPGGEVEIQAGP